MNVNQTTNTAPTKTPAHFIEAVRPHMRKHLKAFEFILANGARVTVWGSGFKDAEKRLRQMTGFEVALMPTPKKVAA